jgi:hypothetical protein
MIRRFGRSRAALWQVVVCTALAVAAAPAAGQVAGAGAAPYLEPTHWAHTALRRAAAFGLIGDEMERGTWSLDRLEAVALLERAAERAQGQGAAFARILEAQAARLRAELPSATARLAGESVRALTESTVGVGYDRRTGDVLTALGGPPFIEEEPTPVADVSDPFATLDLVHYGGRWATRIQTAALIGEMRVGEAYGLASVGAVEFWLGWRHLRLGPGTDAVVLSGAPSLGGGGIETDAFRLPWFLDALGPVRARMALVQMREVAPFEHPWLWVLRASLQPHPRVAVGLNRAAMVAATDQTREEFVKQLLFVLVGKHGEGELNEQDNQIASVDLSYRPPLGPVPLMLYVEWGLEDSAGAWRDVPGVVAGAYLAAAPGAPWLGLNVEAATFSESCCGNPWWYRHRGFLGGWTEQRRPLAHSLGGHGTEWSARADASALAGRVEADLRLYVRDRREENLFSHLRLGGSTGGRVGVSALGWWDMRVGLSGEHERGSDWSRTELDLTLSVPF